MQHYFFPISAMEQGHQLLVPKIWIMLKFNLASNFNRKQKMKIWMTKRSYIHQQSCKYYLQETHMMQTYNMQQIYTCSMRNKCIPRLFFFFPCYNLNTQVQMLIMNDLTYIHQLSDNYYWLEEINEIHLLNPAYLHLFNRDKCIPR